MVGQQIREGEGVPEGKGDSFTLWVLVLSSSMGLHHSLPGGAGGWERNAGDKTELCFL